MLKKILSISGRPGLFRLLSYGKNTVIVENLTDKKRSAAHARDRIVSLGDVAIYTMGDDVPLANVFESIANKYEGKALNPADYKTTEALDTFFKGVLPEFDEERVHKSDIKKIISWYNILVGAGITKFVDDEEKKEADGEEKAEETKADEADKK